MSDQIADVSPSATASTEESHDTTEQDTTTVQVIVKDETDLKNQQRQIINLSVSYTVYDLHSLIGQKVKYKIGTFTLVWDKQDSTVKENEIELDEECKVSLYDFGFKSKRETVCIRDKNDRQPQAVTSDDEGQKNVELRNVTWNTTFNTTASYNGPRPVTYATSSSWYPSYQMQQSETGFVGLVNQAMTCYLNSLLQTLYMSPEFRNAIYKWRFCKAEKDKERCIPYQLQRLFIQLQTSDKRAVETTDVTKSFGWDTNEAWQQHDVQELCRVMFDALEINFKKTEQYSLINHLYQGEMKDYVKCLECNQESARHDTFLDIPLVIKPFGSTTAYVSVEEALEAFIEPETLEGDNQYQCENCSKKCDAHKGLKFTKFPYLLTLQLKRFDFDYTTMHRIKLNDRMTFPFFLDLNEFIQKEGMPDAAKRQKSSDSFVESDRPSSKQSTSSETGSSSANTLEPGMDGYQALPEDRDTEEIANELMSNLNIPSEDSALAPLIVDGDINTDDKILNSPSTPPIHAMDGSDSGLSSRSEDEPTTPNGPPALSSQGGYVSPVENNIEDFSPATKRRVGDSSVTYPNHAGYNQIHSGSDDGDNQAAVEEEKAEDYNPEELLKKGPFVYELFSIMIHSGSAIGGHYYAYIKSLRDKKWYQFNDQSVTTMSYTDIERAYGGIENSRGYYSTLFSSSANAYMLMYRQIDLERNTEFIEKTGFPEHIHGVIREFNEAEIQEKLRIERERSLCKLKLFCNHPKNTVKITELHFEVHKDKTFLEAEDQAYEQLALKDYIPRDCCRLVKYDEVYETLDMSYEEHQNTAFAHLMGGVRHSYIHDLLMEIKRKDQRFQIYKPGGIMVKVYHVDLDSKCVRDPQILRAHQTMTVGEFKRLVEEEMDIPAENMRILLERYYYELRMLEYDHYLLKQEGFYRINKVFVEGGKFDDHLNPIENSQMYRVVDSHINAVNLIISLPSVEEVEREKAEMKAIEAGEDPFDEGPTSGNPEQNLENAKTTEIIPETTVAEDKETTTTTESDKETTTTTTESKKETTTESKEETTTESKEETTTESKQETTTEPKKETTTESKEETTTESKEETTTTTTTTDSKKDTTTDSKADLDSARNKPKPRVIKLKIDKRLTISDLKKRLEPEIGISTDFFKIIRVYSNLQEFEYTRLGDTLSSFVDDVKIVVRLGRALKPGEYRAKVYFLNVKATEEITKFLMDFIVSKELSVKDAKLEILNSINRKKTEYTPEGLTFENLRLRKKTWKNPGSIYFDDQYFDKDINVFNGSEMFVEMLDGVEPMLKQTDLQIYLRRWRPSSYTLDSFEEVTINSNSVDALKHVIAQKSLLPFSNVEFAKGQGSFPCDISLLEIQEELDWNPSSMYINTWPLYMHDDGSVIYYRDKTETLLALSDQKRQELQKRETARLQKLTNTSHMSWVKPKERALIIHVKDTSTTDEPEGDVKIEQPV